MATKIHGQSRETRNIGYKTQNEDKQGKQHNTTAKISGTVLIKKGNETLPPSYKIPRCYS